MNITPVTFCKNEINFNTIDVLENTGLVKAFYTTNIHTDYKYPNGNWLQNYKVLSKLLSIPENSICATHQTHTNNVLVMTSKNAGEGIIKPTAVTDYDGIITNEKNLLLCTYEADCVPVYFLDPVKKVVAMVHSGWKGTAKAICKSAVEKMCGNFGCEAKNIIAVVGPHACKECYEVGKELKEEFKMQFENELDSIFIPFIQDKFKLDMQTAIEITLAKCGIDSKNIYSVDKCTIESKDLCSYRRTHSKTEHMLTAIVLK